MKNLVLVTGATGFIGSHLTKYLLSKGVRVRVTGRKPSESLVPIGAEWCHMRDYSKEVDWVEALRGVSDVVHLAGLAHSYNYRTSNDFDLFNKINHLATKSLALNLRGHPSVRKFLYISTVSVYGTPNVLPVCGITPLNPQTPYSKSKADAEMAIREILDDSSVLWAIMRPVLVYGPGNPGNMARLERLLRYGIPIPVRRIPNRRSFLFIGNLVSAIYAYLQAECPPRGKTWVIADKEAISTRELVTCMGEAMQIHPHFIHLPDTLYRVAAQVGDMCLRMGIPTPWNAEVRRKLLGDFYVDSSPIEDELCWKPPFSTKDGIWRTFAS